ncbi:alpha/beta fold hydrolase [Antrihabitans sp. NCIMB 15449]|uniref:Alpha/beta fold hydrolase n=1 Tax=Antrihabitans spumae TaxID=3373370 RepID=A0ABW7JNL5_9NOCA
MSTSQSFRGVGGIALAADRWGPDDGPVVIMLHGGGQTRHSWKTTGLRLGEHGFRVFALDARGHGESDWSTDRDYDRSTMAQDLLDVLEQIGTHAAVVVGASMGGLTALQASTMVGAERISGIVLVDVVPRPELVGITRVFDFLTAHNEGFASLDDAADAVAAYLPHRERPTNTDGLRRNLRHADDGRWYWHWDPGMFEGETPDLAMQVQHLEDAARKLRIPVMLIRGKLSDVVSEEGVQAFLDLVPHARFVELSAAAHTAAADDNDAFTTAVFDFVTETSAQSRATS